MSSLSMRVLDAALGIPAAGLPVRLEGPPGVGSELAHPVPGRDGRVALDGGLGEGTQMLRSATGPWSTSSDRSTFHPEVAVTFAVDAEQPHHHVALLISPCSCTTYRGR
jgi:5-hydroxyisourate hydrolase